MNRDKRSAAEKFPSYLDDEAARKLCDRLRSEILKTPQNDSTLGKGSTLKQRVNVVDPTLRESQNITAQCFF